MLGYSLVAGRKQKRVRKLLKLEVLREHRPPPNASIIELWQFFPDPDRDPERTPGSG